MKLKIVQVGDPVLREEARPLTREQILGAGVQQLIELMRDTMRDAPGVGLAAPQVGLALQLAVIEDRPEYIALIPPALALERGRRPVPFQVIVNPTITLLPGLEATFAEGCLSLGGFNAAVSRALGVHVDCLNENAEPVHIEAEGWYARILQHEIDHLRGTMYIDRMESRTFSSVDNWRRFAGK